MKRASRTASRKAALALLVLLGACLLSANVSAEILYYNQADFPLTLSSAHSGDTIRFGSPSTWNSPGAVTITLSGTAIFIPSGYGPKGVYIQAGEATIIWGNGYGNSENAIEDNSLDDNGIVVEGGYWLHGDATMRANGGINGSDTAKGCNTFFFRRYNEGGMDVAGYHDVGVLLKDIKLATVTGVNGQIVMAYGKMVEVSGGRFRHEGIGFVNREFFQADVMDFSLPTALNGDPYNFKVHHAVVENAIHRGITMQQSGGYVPYLKGFVYACTVIVDARNDLYKYPGEVGKPNATTIGPGGSYSYGTTNSTAITMDDCSYGSAVYDNVILTDSVHYGLDDAIGVNNVSGTVDEPVQVYGNKIWAHRGLDSHYGYMFCKGIKGRWGLQNIHIHDNEFHLTVDTDSTQTGGSNFRGRTAAGFRWLGSGSDQNVVFENNLIEVINVSPSGSASAFAYILEGAWSVSGYENTNGNRIRNNRCISSSAYTKIGTYDPAHGNYVIYGDTVSMGGNTTGYHTFSFYESNSDNLFFRDNIYTNVDGDDIDFWATSGTELTLQRTLRVFVRGNNALPVTGASITVTNNYGQTVLTGTTNSGGEVSGIVSYWYEQSGASDSTSFNNFTIQASKSGQNSQVNFTVGDAPAQSTDTLSLNLAGDGEWGEGGVGDVTPPAAPSLSSYPGDNEGSTWLVWTAPGDDGNSGQATSYQIRYSQLFISEGNWTQATTVSGVPAPGAAGTQDSILVSSLSPGAYYYFAMRATDDEGNGSSLGTTNSFAAGIIAPVSLSTPIVVNDETGEAEVYAQPVSSYMSLRYDFQLDDTPGFPSPAAETGGVSGSYITADFSGLTAGDTLYWRCRAAALDDSFTSPWSATRVFTLSGGAVNNAPATPVANDPLDGDTVTSTQPLLTVNNSNDPDGDPLTYDFEVYSDGGIILIGSSYGVNEGVSTTSWEVTAGLLQLDSSYFWRARANDGTDFSSWTAFEDFTVDELAASHSPTVAAAKAYPSPVNFSSGDVLTFELPSTPVDLTILSPSGHVVRYVENVTDSWSWNGTNQSGNAVASGVYSWYLSDGTSKKVVVIR